MPLPITSKFIDTLVYNDTLGRVNKANHAYFNTNDHNKFQKQLRHIQNTRPESFQRIHDDNTNAKIKALNMVDMPNYDVDNDSLSQLGYRNANTQIKVPFGFSKQPISLGTGATNGDNDRYLGFHLPARDQVYIPESTINSNTGEKVMRHELDHRAFNKLGNNRWSPEQEHDIVYNRDYDQVGPTSQYPNRQAVDKRWSASDKPTYAERQADVQHNTSTSLNDAKMLLDMYRFFGN